MKKGLQLGILITTMVVSLFTVPVTAFAQQNEQKCGDNYCDRNETLDPFLCPEDCGATGEIPYYFIAVHNENRADNMEAFFHSLIDLVRLANAYRIKLTLMFTPQWTPFLLEDPGRLDLVLAWARQGHEIAGHHHSIWHGSWDGFTYLPEEQALEIRHSMGRQESYLGTLDDYILALRTLNPRIHSGCMNDEKDKQVMPDAIIYDSCSGFANFGPAGRTINDRFAIKGINKYISVGEVNGIQRKWLTHAMVTNEENERKAERIFLVMGKGAYGTVTHSTPDQVHAMEQFLEFLHRVDPSGQKSRTMSQVIDEAVIPEMIVPGELLQDGGIE